MTLETATQILEATASRLSEHFEAIQIVASYPASTGGTQMLSSGRGNWYARQGMSKAFVESDQATTLANELNKNRE